MSDAATLPDSMDDIEAQVEKRLRDNGGSSSTKAAPAPKRKKLSDLAGDGQMILKKAKGGGQIFGLVLDIFKSKGESSWEKLNVLVLGEGENMEQKDFIEIPHSLTKKSLDMALATLLKRTAETRPIWKVARLQTIEMTTFNDRGCRVGEFALCSGVRYELGAFVPRTDKNAEFADAGEPDEGDAFPEITCEYVNPIKDAVKMALLGKLLSEVKIGPVRELTYGADPIPYPDDIPRWPESVDFRGRTVRNAMIPFEISNEVLFNHMQCYPTTIVHIANKRYRTMHDELPKIEGETEQPGTGPTPCISKIPDRDCLVREVKTDTKKKAVLASAKGSKQNGNYSITIADLSSDIEGTILGIFWDNEIRKLGVQGLQAWEEYGNQLVRGLDAIVGVSVDKGNCYIDDNFMGENRVKFFLGTKRLTFLQVDYKQMFRWIGVRVPIEIAEQVCLKGLYGKQWQTKPKKLAPRWKDASPTPGEVTLGSRLAVNPGDESVKAICLAEVTGEIESLTPPQNWIYYMVPPGFCLNEPDEGQYLEELGFYKINDMSDGAQRDSEIEKLMQGPNMDKWTVFAIRR